MKVIFRILVLVAAISCVQPATAEPEQSGATADKAPAAVSDEKPAVTGGTKTSIDKKTDRERRAEAVDKRLKEIFATDSKHRKL